MIQDADAAMYKHKKGKVIQDCLRGDWLWYVTRNASKLSMY
jgi:hypothetical protein